MNGLARADPAVAWLWQEKELPTEVDQLAETLRCQGFDVHTKSCGELGAPSGLQTSTPDVLVLPYGNQYPAALAAALVGYSKRGGALLVTGGEHAFDVPLYPTASGTHALLDAGDEVARLTPAAPWKQAVARPEDSVRVQVDEDAIRFEMDLTAYAYAAVDLLPLTATDAVVELQVRGEEGVRLLALDFQERDGIRWKHILPVTSEWTTHWVHLAQFLSYKFLRLLTGPYQGARWAIFNLPNRFRLDAHAFANTQEHRDRYASYLQTALITPMLESKGAWWGHSNGRHALNLFGLVYCSHRINDRAELKAGIYRALCAMFSTEVPGSIPDTIAKNSLAQPEWLYISYGALGLADFVSPLVSMDKWR